MTRSLRAVHQTRAGRRTRRGLALALAAIGLANPLRADEITWDNTSGDFLWSTSANWTPDALPAATDTLLFTETGAGTINLGGLTRTAAGLTLDTDTSAYTFSNGTLQLPSITQTAGSAIFNTALKAPSGLMLDVQANTLSLLGAVTATGLTKTGDGTVLIGGTTSAITGTTNLNAGKLLVTAPNAFNGTMRLVGGTLELRSNGTTFLGTYNVAADSALIVSRASGTGGTTTISALTLGDSTLSISTLNGQTLKVNSLTLGGAASINAGMPLQVVNTQQGSTDTLTISGPADVTFTTSSSPYHLTVNGPGRTKLSSVNTAVVNGGMLEAIGVSGSLTINPGGAAQLFGGNASTTGTTTLAGGTLFLTVPGSSYGPGSARVAVTDDSTIAVEAAPSGSTPDAYISTLTLSGPTLTVTNAANNRLNVSTLTVSAPSALRGQAVLASTPQNPAVKILKTTLNSRLSLTGGGSMSLAGLTGNGDLMVDGPGRLLIDNTLNDNTKWTGRLLINAGTVVLGPNALNKGLGLDTNTLNVPDGATLAVDGIGLTYVETQVPFTRNITISGQGAGGAGALSYTNPSGKEDGILTGNILLAGPSTINVNTSQYYSEFHIGDPKGKLPGGSLSGTGPLTKIGGQDNVGTMHINVAATYTGGTIVNAGAVSVGPLGSLVNTGPITVNPTGMLNVFRPAGNNPAQHSVNPHSVTVNGGTLSLSDDVDPAEILSSASTGGHIALAGNSRDINLSRLVPGVSGSSWRLSGAMLPGGTFPSFAPTLYDRALSFDEPTTLVLGGGSGAAGTLQLGGDLASANNIAAVTVNGRGTFHLMGRNDYAGDTTIASGSLVVYGDESVGTSTGPILLGDSEANGGAGLSVAQGTTLTRDILVRSGSSSATLSWQSIPDVDPLKPTAFAGNITLERDLKLSGVTITGTISGPGGISGSGILKGENTYSGPTKVTSGVLDASTTSSRTLGRSTSITVSGGVLRVRPENYDPAAVFLVETYGALGMLSNTVPPLDSRSQGTLGIDIDNCDAVTSAWLRLGSTSSGRLVSQTLTPGWNGSARIYRFGGGGGTLAVANPVLVDAGSATSLEMDRGGTLVLHGDNSYSGRTNVSSGLVVAGDDARVLGKSRDVYIGGGILRLRSANNYDPAAVFTVYHVLALQGDFVPAINASSRGTISVETESFSAITSLATLGNGTMYIASETAGTLTPPTLAPGTGAKYRFGGRPGTLTVLTDLSDGAGVVRSLDVGNSYYTRDNGTVILAGQNTFSGPLTAYGDGKLVVTGKIVCPVTVGVGGAQFLADQTLPSLTAPQAPIDVGEGVTVSVAQFGSSQGMAKTGPGTLRLPGSLSSSVLISVDAGTLALDGGTNPGAVLIAAIAKVAKGYNGGTWDGTSGITSTTARGDAAKLTGLAVVLNNDGSGNPLLPAASAIATDILVVPSLYGDTNLDGQVDALDYFALDAAVLAGVAATWRSGDFDYNGILNGDDYFRMDSAFLNQTALPSLASMANVPEPATLLLLPLALLTLTRRRLRS